jgi:hypothetical protein
MPARTTEFGVPDVNSAAAVARTVSIRGMPPGRGLYPGDRLGSMT